jgi:cytochrome b involved in lipid metabolism
MTVQLFTYEEVAKHNTRNDLFMIIDKKVYDITKFLDEVKKHKRVYKKKKKMLIT